MNFGISVQALNDKTIAVLFLLGIVILCILPVEAISPVLILLLGLVLGVAIISVFAPEDFNFLFNYFAIALSIRAFLSSLFYAASLVLRNDYTSGFLFLNDGVGYSHQGWQICKFAERGIKITIENFMSHPAMMDSHWAGNITPYDFFTGFVYSLTGHSPLSLFFISSVAGALSGIFIYLLAKEIFSRRIARTASIFAFFWPSFILWSTQHLKEPMLTMLLGIILWTALYAHRHVSVGFGILSAITALLFFKTSAPFAVVTISAILISFALLSLRGLLKSRFIALVTMGIVIVALVFIAQNWLFTAILNMAGYKIALLSSHSFFEFLNYSRSVRAHGNLQFMTGFSISNPIKALAFAPIGFIYSIFAPFPWQIGSLAQIMAIPETLIFYIFIPATLKGIIFAYKKRFWPSIFLMSIILVILGFLALVEGNSGTLFRHRVPAFYLLFVFTSAGLALKDAKD